MLKVIHDYSNADFPREIQEIIGADRKERKLKLEKFLKRGLSARRFFI